jgi:glycosyltransferase involved in cell wall biosynthesis
MKSICFFGGFETGYPRSDVLRKGLEKHGVTVHMCRTSPRRRGIVRAVVLAYRYFAMNRPFSVIYVPEFRHKDVPLAYVLAKVTRKRLVFDPLVSRFDTKILDRGDAREGSVQAWHNRNLDWISLRLPDIVLADTQAHADYYTSEFGVPAGRIRVLPVGFDEDLFDFRHEGANRIGDDAAFTVLFFGNYLPLHGVEVIVSAAEMLKEFDKIRFDLIGRGQTFGRVEAFVRAHDLTNVRLLPRVPIDSLPSRIAAADVCLGIFGRTEKAGRVVANKVYQAMAMGRPVITADSTAVREYFVDSTHICLVAPGNPDALAEKIRHLYKNATVRQAIGEHAARWVHERFTSKALAGRFLEYCEELRRTPKGRRGNGEVHSE